MLYSGPPPAYATSIWTAMVATLVQRNSLQTAEVPSVLDEGCPSATDKIWCNEKAPSGIRSWFGEKN